NCHVEPLNFAQDGLRRGISRFTGMQRKIRRLVRSSPDSLAATLAAPPSMSLIPVAPFLDFVRNDRRRVFHTRVKENLLLGACFVSKFQSWIQTKQRKIFRTRLTSTFCTDRLSLSMCRNLPMPAPTSGITRRSAR